MPYKLGEIWNEANTYITTDKNVGINTNYPTSTLDINGNITENGQQLKDKYTLQTDDNKKQDLLIVEDRTNFTDYNPIVWYKFDESNFTSNEGIADNIKLIIDGTRPSHKSNYIIGTDSAKINSSLSYEIIFDTGGGNTNLLTSSKHTICFWIYFNDVSNNKTIINSIKSDNRNFNRNFKVILENRDIKFITYNDLEQEELSLLSTRKFKDNQWYHITFSIDMEQSENEELIIYVDGMKANSKVYHTESTNVIINRANNPLTIFLGDSNLSESFDGYIDDFRIYDDKLELSNIQQNIIGNLTRISPGNISSIGNYGIDILNFSNLVTVGNSNNPVDLQVSGNLLIDTLSLKSNDIEESHIDYLTVNSNIIIKSSLRVNNSIVENDQDLIKKYALKADVDKNTDVIISKMINNQDVNELYNKMPLFFREKVLIEYNFDFNKDNLNDVEHFLKNSSTNNYDPYYNNFANYNLQSSKANIEIDDYGEKYVKGTSSLKCIDQLYYYFEVSTEDQSYFRNDKSYTIVLWIRLIDLNIKQYLLKLGDTNYIELYVKENNKLEFLIYNSTSAEYTRREVPTTLKKDEWYHITCIINKFDHMINILSLTKSSKEYDDIISAYSKYNYYIDNQDSNKLSKKQDPNISNEYDIYIYINGIIQTEFQYNNIIFTDVFNSSSNYLGSSNALSNLNGYIDDFKIYDELVPIKYITENIIGNALILTPGKLSAIGNYGIDIKNFESLVTIGNLQNQVNLNVYGELVIANNTLFSTITTIDNNVLQTSNFIITDTLNTVCNISTNIQVENEINGNGFKLGDSNYINLIQIDTLSNNDLFTDNIKSSSIHTGTLTVDNPIADITINTLNNTTLNGNDITATSIDTGTLTVDNPIVDITINTLNNTTLNGNAITATSINTNSITISNPIENVSITNINIGDVFIVENNYTYIYSNIVIGDDSFNNNRFDLGRPFTRIRNDRISTSSDNTFTDYKDSFINFDTDGLVPQSNANINIFDKSFIFYGITDDSYYDIYLKNSYIRDDNCNIQEEINKSHTIDRNRTRIKSDVGNIKLDNGFIELSKYNNNRDSYNTVLSTLIINEDSIVINDTTKLDSTLKLTNNENHVLLTSSNLLFDNGNGFTDSNTLTIDTINITTLSIPSIKTNLLGSSIIDINETITTTNDISANNITITNTTNTSDIICSNIECKEDIIVSNILTVETLVVKNNIRLGDDSATTSGNSIDGGFGSLNIDTITTKNITCESNINTEYLNVSNFATFSNLNCEDTIITYILDATTITVNNILTCDDTINTNDLIVSNLITTCNLTCEDTITTDILNTNTITVNNTLTCDDTIYTNDLIISNLTDTSNLTTHYAMIDTLLDANTITVNNLTCDDTIYTNDLIVSNLITTCNLTCEDTITTDILNTNTITVNNTLTCDDTIYTNDLIVSNLTDTSNLTSHYATINTLLNANTITVNNLTCDNTIYTNDLIVSNLTDTSNLTSHYATIDILLDANTITVNNITCDDTIYTNDLIVSNLTDTSNLISHYATINTLLNANTITVNNLKCDDTIYTNDLIVSNLTDTSNLTSHYAMIDTLLNANTITVNNTLTCDDTIYTEILKANTISNLDGTTLTIIGNLLDNSEIDINCNITTTKDINCSNLKITNQLICDTLSGISGLCIIDGLLSNDSIIDITGEIKTTGAIIGSTLSGIITDSEINTSCNITTTDTLSCKILNVTDNTLTTEITSNNITVDHIKTRNIGIDQYAIDTKFGNNFGIIRCKLSSDSVIDLAGTIKCDSLDINQILNAVNFHDTLIVKRNNHIACYDSTETYHMRLNANNLQIVFNNDITDTHNKNIIEYVNQETVIRCDVLEVANFDVSDSSQFAFPNIISYAKNSTIVPPIANVLIGYQQNKNEINFDNTKDVLYVHTPDNSRLRCGNILVENNIFIGDEDIVANQLRIITGTIDKVTNSTTVGNPYATFTNKDSDSIIVLSLANGTVGINATPPTESSDTKLFVGGAIQTSGDIIAFQSISDKRFKENIEPLKDDIDIVNKLNPVKFKWKKDLFNKANAGKNDIGFIAQEIEELIPCAVSDTKIELTETDYKYIKYERLIPYLVNNIKYLNSKIVELENKLK